MLYRMGTRYPMTRFHMQALRCQPWWYGTHYRHPRFPGRSSSAPVLPGSIVDYRVWLDMRRFLRSAPNIFKEADRGR